MTLKCTIVFILSFYLSIHTFSQSVNEIAGPRWTIDSANYKIFRGKYLSGEMYLEFYKNILNKLDSCKFYYKNGQTKEEGTMTNEKHICVGIWKYYSSNGKIDSTVNYDAKNSISYFKAIEIARTKEFKMPDISVNEKIYKNKKYWEFDKWHGNSGNNSMTAETILIDKETGEIIKPDFILKTIF